MPPQTKKSPLLNSPGWSGAVRRQLEKLILTGAGRQLPVVFDFDNTVVCGDIGEATLALLVREGSLSADRLPEALSPALVSETGQPVTAASAVDLTEYYEAFLAPTAHGPKDPFPQANGYLWAVQAMQGLDLHTVVEATRRVMEWSRPGGGNRLEVTPGRTSYPIPWFYPEMVELIAALIRHEYDLWIVSASNVWTVRWMALHGLNPLLRAQGVRGGISPRQVVGVSTLMADRQGRLYKDSVLTRENRDYAWQCEPAMKALRVTSHPQYPAPTYSGKVGAIWDVIGRRPYLCAGDSPGDLPMLAFSENRLWMARLEKPDYQKAALKLMRQADAGQWVVQPVLASQSPGFIGSRAQLSQRLARPSPGIAQSLRLLRDCSGKNF
jgi:phosphoserine phosphatase